MIREFLGFGSSTVLEQGARLGTSLVAAGLVGPVEWGTWYMLNLILRYGSLAHLGVMNGLNRQFALELGRGDAEEAHLLRRTTLGAVLVSSVVVLLIAAVILMSVGASAYLVPMALTLVLLVAHQVNAFVITTFKAGIQFSHVSRFQAVHSVLNPLVTIPMTLWLGLNGYIIGQTLCYGAVALIAYLADRSIFVVRLDLARATKLVRIGFPIMLVGVLYSLFTTVDRWVVVHLMSTEALGHYSIAIMALGAAILLPQVVAQQYYPRMAKLWGANQDLQELKEIARKQGWYALVPTALVVAAAAALGPPLIRQFLPAYAPGIPAFYITMLAPVVNTFGQGYANVLNVTDRQHIYLGVIVMAVVVNALSSLALGATLGLAGVAWGTVLGFATFSAGLVILGRSQVEARTGS